MKAFCDISDEYIESKHRRIASNIKNIRIQKGITQEYIALCMGFTTATFYTNAENFKNSKHFNLEHLMKIAIILDVDMCEFFK